MYLSFLEQIVCRNCSRNKYPLKYLKDQAAKVCDSCYMELKKRGKIPSFLAKLTNLVPVYITGRVLGPAYYVKFCDRISHFKHEACVLTSQEWQAVWQLKLY